MDNTDEERTITRPGVQITGISIPFWDLVVILTKVTFAALPAAVIAAVIVALAGALVYSVLIGIGVV
jgi:hypothetical protein